MRPQCIPTPDLPKKALLDLSRPILTGQPNPKLSSTRRWPSVQPARLALNIQVSIFQGLRGRRRLLHLPDVHPASSIYLVGQKVIDLLGVATPEELTVLIGSKAAPPDAKLSEFILDSSSQVHVLIWYPDFHKQDFEASNSGEECHSPSWEGNDAASEGFSNSAARFKLLSEYDNPAELAPPSEERQMPPPLLIRGSQPPQVKELLAPSENLEEGCFQLPIQCRIFLGQHGHKRSTSLRVSPETPVQEMVEHLNQWLGSPPDELLLTVNGTLLESECRVKDYDIGPTDTVGAIAWYEKARNGDLVRSKQKAQLAALESVG